jgi:hypothetical protein
MPLPGWLANSGLNKIQFELCSGSTYGTRLSAKLTHVSNGGVNPWSITGWVKWPKNVVYPDWNDPFKSDNKPYLGLTICYTFPLDQILKNGKALGLVSPGEATGLLGEVAVAFQINFEVCLAFAVEADLEYSDLWIMASGGPGFTVTFPGGIEGSNTGKVYGHWILKDAYFKAVPAAVGDSYTLDWDKTENHAFWQVEIKVMGHAFVTLRGPISEDGILLCDDVDYASTEAAVFQTAENTANYVASGQALQDGANAISSGANFVSGLMATPRPRPRPNPCRRRFYGC